MRTDVLLLTAWFPPEPAPFGQMMLELAQHLASLGLKVDVITCVPNYPHTVVYEGWRNRLIQIEDLDRGIRVIRLGILGGSRSECDGPPTRAGRALSFAWFTLSSFVAALVHSRPSVILAVLQPLTVALPVLMFGKLRRAPVIFSIQDLHPDALIALGLVRQPSVIRTLRWIEQLAYRQADALTVISDGFRDHCIERGARPERVQVIPNWIDMTEIHPLDRSSRLRSAIGVGDLDFVALYAGTLGLASGAEVVIDAAARLGEKAGIRIVFVGQGQLKPRLEDRVRELGLKHVTFLPFQPREQLNEVQALGDVSLVTLLPGHGRTSVPSKVLGYLAAARPVIASVERGCETARLVERADAGWIVDPQDPDALADALVASRNDAAERVRRGKRGRAYLELYLSKERILGLYESLISGLNRVPS